MLFMIVIMAIANLLCHVCVPQIASRATTVCLVHVTKEHIRVNAVLLTVVSHAIDRSVGIIVVSTVILPLRSNNFVCAYKPNIPAFVRIVKRSKNHGLGEMHLKE